MATIPEYSFTFDHMVKKSSLKTFEVKFAIQVFLLFQFELQYSHQNKA
jgi:hypothetical protein